MISNSCSKTHSNLVSNFLAYIDEIAVVALLQIVQHRGLVQIGQSRHVFYLKMARFFNFKGEIYPNPIELGWVSLLDVVLAQSDLLARTEQLHHKFIARLTPEIAQIYFVDFKSDILQ